MVCFSLLSKSELKSFGKLSLGMRRDKVGICLMLSVPMQLPFISPDAAVERLTPTLEPYDEVVELSFKMLFEVTSDER